MTENRSKVYLGKLNPESETFPNEIKSGLSYFKDFLLNIKETISKTIILKPNILPTEFRRNGLAVTNPRFCSYVAEHFIEIGFSKIILAEGTTYSQKGNADTFEGMKNHGFSDFLDKWEQFDMNKDEPGKWFTIYSPGDEENPEDPLDIEVGISKLALTHPIVSCAKLKAHDVLGLTLAIKNLMGCLCQARRKSTREILHKGSFVKKYLHGYGPRNPYELPSRELNWKESKTALAINLNRLAQNILPTFSVVEAVPAMEGNGPLFGLPKKMDLFLCSNDSVALESVAYKLIGITLEYNQYVKNFERLNLGICDYDKIDIINQELITQFILTDKFKLHEWFQFARFTPQEIELLKKFTS